MQRAPIWTGVVIGLLLGMVLGAAWLLGRNSAETPQTVVQSGGGTR